ncbi:hypothetical protein DSD19_10435 [Rhodovulum sp. BSW8]|uniref:Uncharacterized protein n=3 Tax=Rhodovulum TaxID=34008 RepID=A0A4R8FYT7_9RHOB|nr:MULTISPECIES: hypothetical protein [Rhodovulum]OLS43134.1 hypothetical protein BV509_01430 [Rhodovulum sulfidophilum]MBL3570793.1 hypothetical protein [Rhodovulum visakhapatnamense]MBL3578620.1 hypothetical protein [Rhodovulum visakhapatnamense]PTW50643.1 hypothetical protein C8N38_104279 [Rhodovulum kholense]RAP42319.1 hypothetical protein BYZ73_06080 [Rhodovulum viride]
MFSLPLDEAERRARAFSHRLALGTAGSLCAGVGAAFLTGAAWLVLSAGHGAVFAATVIGAAYLGVGLIFWGLSLRRSPPARPAAPADPYTPFVHMAEGFAAGLEAGRAARAPNGDARH